MTLLHDYSPEDYNVMCELIQRAQTLLNREPVIQGEFGDGGYKELEISGYLEHEIVLEGDGTSIGVHYMTTFPVPVIVYDSDREIGRRIIFNPNELYDTKLQLLILEALRRYMVLDDIAGI